MLGIEKDPKLHKIREGNPLNKIVVPQGNLMDLDDRIEQFRMPIDADLGYHPLLVRPTKARQGGLRVLSELKRNVTIHGMNGSDSRSSNSKNKSPRSGKSNE